MRNKSFMERVGRFVLLAVVVFVAWGAYKRLERNKLTLPDGVVWGNGRIEAIQVDIASKSSGRIAEVIVKEGDMVEVDQVLCRMDTAELDATLENRKAQLAKAEEDAAEAEADVVQKEANASLAEKSFARAETLKKRNAVSDQSYDEEKARRESASAVVDVAKARLRSTLQGVSAAEAEVKRIQSLWDDTVLKSPVKGRVLYRMKEPGSVVGAGEKMLTVLDLSDIYMEIFLPAQEAARAHVGAEARLVFDAAPEYAAEAHVSFVSPEAQFTPKQVETRSERDKQQFRLKLQIPPEKVAPYINRIKTGVRGLGYVRLDDRAVWPARLERRFPPPAASSAKTTAPSSDQVSPAPKPAETPNKNTASPAKTEPAASP
ncbi:MAG: efflux RND transporter periplasmic adaptor subunit [Planctomycetota bacterium]|nr:efflux RND transporter periplasmic adaptor subunit [Planctomycetota bacterium]